MSSKEFRRALERAQPGPAARNSLWRDMIVVVCVFYGCWLFHVGSRDEYHAFSSMVHVLCRQPKGKNQWRRVESKVATAHKGYLRRNKIID